VWQALAYGFAGLQPRGDALAIDPQLPGSWSGLEIGVQFHGVAVRLRLEHDAVVACAPAPIVLDVRGDRVSCAAGRSRLQLGG
jgi:trehalose/maltose hydrolase-like predicted phosphorylase